MKAEPAARALRVNDAVKAYGVGRTTLYALIKQGELPDVKVCGRRVIPVSALEALIKEKGARYD